MTTTKTTVILNIRCRAFSSEGVRENRIKVTEDDRVLVYDSVAGHYTQAHSLSASATRKALRDAAGLRAGRFDESHTCQSE